MPRPLTLSPAPFKSSYLAIPPTPFSPKFPITPSSTPPKDVSSTVDRARIKATAELLPPPPNPLHWLWQCHRCNRVYQLGVTRRCLDDGHLFCAGTTVTKRSKRNGYKKVLRHQACASEFDYGGWKAWGTWRRQIDEQVWAAEALLQAEKIMDSGAGRWSFMREQVERANTYWETNDIGVGKKKDCWGTCDYPSECRWGKQYGVKTPVMPSVVLPSSPAVKDDECSSSSIKECELFRLEETPPPAQRPQQPKTNFDELLFDLCHPDHLEPLTPTESNSNSNGHDVKAVTEGETKMISIQDLVQSAHRRRHKSQSGMPLIPSPLALNPPSPEAETSPKIQIMEWRPEDRKNAQRAVDDFDLELKKGFDVAGLQSRAEAFMRGWKAKLAA